PGRHVGPDVRREREAAVLGGHVDRAYVAAASLDPAQVGPHRKRHAVPRMLEDARTVDAAPRAGRAEEPEPVRLEVETTAGADLEQPDRERPLGGQPQQPTDQ